MDHRVSKSYDRSLAVRLRSENPGQYNTLVRMHISWMELQTEIDEESGHEKGLFRKFNRFSKKTKPLCASNKSVTNSPPDCEKQALSQQTVAKLVCLIEFLMKDENLIQEGIFRRTGSVARQSDLKCLLLASLQPVNLDNGEYTVHDCASVLKGILSDLPEPLLMDAFYAAHCQLATMYNATDPQARSSIDDRLTNALQLLFLVLPSENRELMDWLLRMLNKTCKFTATNKMSADTLSTLFTPHLICPRRLAPEALHSISQQMAGLVSFMIAKGEQLFDIPEKLSTDIRMYFEEQKRKRAMSPEMILDETVSDSTAATVYTFVDREQTAKANDANPTDTALAQLYAHIQSLPESSKKRKLIKQFNKENGHGTPLQFVMMNRMKNGHSVSSKSSSLSDSIKRHILGKGLLQSRTPKRSHLATPASPAVAMTTPNQTKYNTINRLHVHGRKKLFPTPQKVVERKDLPPPSPPRAVTHVPLSNNKNNDKPLVTPNEPGVMESTIRDRSLKLKAKGPTKVMRKYPSEPNLRSDSDDSSAVNSKVCVSLMDLKEMSRGSHNMSGVDDLIKDLSGHVDTPQKVTDRTPVSPITKSTRHMPRYMQKDIMTPRSRKPVVVLQGLSIDNTSSNSSDSKTLSFCEDDEYSLDMHGTRNNSDIMKVSSFESTGPTDTSGSSCGFQIAGSDDSSVLQEKVGQELKTVECQQVAGHTLTSTFKDYLFSRSVGPESPADLSFSSQPDDFGANLEDVDEEKLCTLEQSKMSDSLLYCLDGNKPDELDGSPTNGMHLEGCMSNCRKRPSSGDDVDDNGQLRLGPDEEREIKKLVLHVDENPAGVGETSL